MQGMVAAEAMIDHADFTNAHFEPIEKVTSSKPPTVTSPVPNSDISTIEALQAILAALSAQQQQPELKITDLSQLKSAKGAILTNTNLTRTKLDGSNLAGAKCNATDLSSASMTDVNFGKFPMPAKPEAKTRGNGAARNLTVQLGKAMVEGGGNADDADADDDGDDDEEEAEDNTEGTQALLVSMVKNGASSLASAVAKAVPQVIYICQEADKLVDAAVDKVKEMCSSDLARADLRVLRAAAGNADRDAAAASIENLLRQVLDKLLDEVFGESGMLPRQLNEAKKRLSETASKLFSFHRGE